ncbi:hypothetical protein ID866_5302 [Astraeus odoratus]|nr:hypothetical protein ID866_5302 [Astraeus odoratus]
MMLRTGIRTGRLHTRHALSSSRSSVNGTGRTRNFADAGKATSATSQPASTGSAAGQGPASDDGCALESFAFSPTASTNSSGPSAFTDASASTTTTPDLDTQPTSTLETLKGRIREWADVTAMTLAWHINRATGYDAIDVLKRQVVEQESRIKAAREAARAAKAAYDEAVIHRAAAQRDVNELLQRKSSWSDGDVVRFTALVRADHAREQEEARAKTAVAASEDAVEREFSALMRAILARYHEEQVWSDKIRSVSTYGSLAVLGVNVVVFVAAILFVEPWKRKRLAQTFERKVEELGVETKALIDEGNTKVGERLANQERLLAEMFNHAAYVHEMPGSTSSPASAMLLEEQGPSEEQGPATQLGVSRAWLGALGSRELVLIAGSAAVGGAISLLTRSLFDS